MKSKILELKKNIIVSKKIISLILIVAFFVSCSEYQKALKSEDVAVKFTEATKKYEEKKYNINWYFDWHIWCATGMNLYMSTFRM